MLRRQAYLSKPSRAASNQEPWRRQTAIPPEDQATKEQLAKLFDVMRIRDQMQSMRKIVPTMVQTQMQRTDAGR